MNKKEFFKNKIILITGGTGSFGHAMTVNLLNMKPKEIRIFSRDEKKQDDMRKNFNNQKLKFYVGDIRDYSSVKNVVNNVDYIFHAAALKQVPSCEFYPMEAVKTNILGVENLLNAAEDAHVKKIICLSTDKAVYPINAMGVSKSMMEKVIIAKSRTLKNKKTKVCITRYGNVIYSRGSVIPLFVKQVFEKKSITVTDMSMTRFMMSMNDAIDLVLFAFNNGNNGEIFIKKSPAATIKTIILALKKILSRKITTKIIGPRHGEKYHETLMTKEEMAKSKNYKNFYKIASDNRDLNYEKFFSKGKKVKKTITDYTSANTKILTIDETIKILKPIIKNNYSI
jgi:UDP-N-acetylglucosamine 4,6-dehydratase/5-epimerase